MYVSKQVKVQLALFATIAVAAGSVMVFGYAKLPAVLFGVGRYDVTVQLREAAGLYGGANVTYRGVEVGKVTQLGMSGDGVEAVLSLKSGIDIPSDVDADVHSVSAVGEQYVALTPRGPGSSPLKDGDVIAEDHTSVPTDVNSLLDDTNAGLAVVPREELRTVIDESYEAVGGLGPELRRLVRASTTLAADSRANVDSLTSLVDQSAPVLDSQTDTAGAIRRWAARVADLTGQLRSADKGVSGVLRVGGPAADQGRQLVERLAPTLPILLANLTSVGGVTVAYHAGLEQLLVLLPQGVAQGQGAGLANRNVPGLVAGAQQLSVHVNLGIPPLCQTGFLPQTQQRAASFVDSPPRPEGDLYCRVPQDSRWNVRGARNIPCETKPGKRAPTAAMCESDEQYVPLNDGFMWKGDPNATLSGQDVPQLPPGSAPSPPAQAPAAATPAAPTPPEAPAPIATADYDPTTGAYLAPDGKVYTESELARTGPPPTWQSMLIPAG
jgi:phospholipid/cholesterol/gamma-HCH transport system substrate-binding protein